MASICSPEMPRRAFMAVIAGSLLASPLAAEAQRPRAIRVGWLAPDSRPDAFKWCQEALKELGWVEGSNFAIEQRYARGGAERYAELASDLLHIKVDVLVTDGSPATKAAQRATTTTPIIFISGNPVAQGFVTSLSSPGGNLTGVAIITGDLNPKRIQLLKEAAPRVTRLAFLEDQSARGSALNDTRPGENWQSIEAVSRQLGIQATEVLPVRKPDEMDRAFALAAKQRMGGVLVLASALFSSQTQRIVSLAARGRLPAIYEHEGFVEAGGLMSYGPSHRDIFRLIAGYVDKILKGAKPADLPVEEPTKLKLVINLRTARALGLAVPPSLLQRADQVIE
jgi:putative ABC transport system substrate-binding protein